MLHRMSKEVLEDNLRGFCGSEQYYRHHLNKKMIYTDGIEYLAKEGHCYWLIDLVASWQPELKRQEFQHWTVTIESGWRALTDQEKKLVAEEKAVVLDASTPWKKFMKYRDEKQVMKGGKAVQLINLKTTGMRKATIICGNGSGKELARQVTDTDLVLEKVDMYCQLSDEDGTMCLMLTSEY